MRERRGGREGGEGEEKEVLSHPPKCRHAEPKVCRHPCLPKTYTNPSFSLISLQRLSRKSMSEDKALSQAAGRRISKLGAVHTSRHLATPCRHSMAGHNGDALSLQRARASKRSASFCYNGFSAPKEVFPLPSQQDIFSSRFFFPSHTQIMTRHFQRWKVCVFPSGWRREAAAAAASVNDAKRLKLHHFPECLRHQVWGRVK